MWRDGESGKQWEKSLGIAAVLLQAMQKILHSRPETARNPAGNQTARHKDAAWRHERTEDWGSNGVQSSKCIQLVKKNSLTQTYTEQRFAGVYELDELYWFIERKSDTQTRENMYLMTMISREPRQIQAFRVAQDKCAWRIQEMVDEAPKAGKYCSDGYFGYSDVDYYGAEYVRNSRNKADTHHIESVNADLRCFIAGLQRRSRCFYRTLATFEAVVDAFVEAYNAFGAWKLRYRRPVTHMPGNENKHLHRWNYGTASLFDFVVVS